MATTTYVALKTTTVGTATSSVTLSGFSSSYKHLVIAAKTKSTRASLDSLYVQFNGDTGSNYSEALMQANGTATSKGASTSNTRIYAGNTPGTNASTSFGISKITIYDYNSSTNKNVMCVSGSKNSASNGTVDVIAGTWRNGTPVPITSITLSMGNANIEAGSEFILYGLDSLADSNSGVKATGGFIYNDDSYIYHVFSGTSVFAPTQSINADVLCIAGGGGGGTANRGGGGGAGGIIYFAGQSLTATNYNVTVGAGGNQFGQGNNSQFASLTVASGGGRGGASNFGGAYLASAGGSGGGNGNDGTNNGGASNQSSTGATAIYGNRGGNVTVGGDVAGGGGSGAAGTDGVNSNDGIAGGIGTTAFASWGLATGIGQFVNNTYYIAAGGNGGANYSGGGNLRAIRPLGGGGFSSATLYDASGLPNTGSGGAGFSYNSGSSTYPAGFGGSGVVIVRYAK